MDWQPIYVRSHRLSLIVKLESVIDSRGNLLYCVTLASGEKENKHFCFHHLDSAIDFINTNFNHR